MKKLMTVATVALAIAFGATESKAEERSWEWSPIGLGIAAPLQIPWMSSDVYGLRLGSFFGYNNEIYGVDWTLVGMQTGAMYGLQATGFAWASGEVRGLQAAAVANVTYEDIYGLQIGSVNVNWGETFWGLEIGAVNYGVSLNGMQVSGLVGWNNSSVNGLQIASFNADQEDFTGASFGFINYAARLCGCQIGGINLADEATGCQIGLVNATDDMRGVQIGFINLICDSRLPIMVIANAKF